MSTEKFEPRPIHLDFDLSVESQFPACFQATFGSEEIQQNPLVKLLQANLPYFDTEVGFVLAEILEIQRVGGKAKVFIYSRHENDEQREEFKKKYFDILLRGLSNQRGWSISLCENLYFGDGKTHKIFCSLVDNGEVSINPESSPPKWNNKLLEHPLRRDYSKLQMQDSDTLNAAWAEYVQDFNEFRKSIDQSRFFYNLLVPISFNSPPDTNHLKQALGAIFITFGTNKAVEKDQLLNLYNSLQLFWHYNYSAESADVLIKRKDELEKYKDIFNLLQRPLDRLGSAIQSMQQDVRDLSAVLYEPNEGLFRFHKAIVDLFDDTKSIKISKRVSIPIQHNNKYSDSTAAALIVAAAVWRLLGLQFDLEGLNGVEVNGRMPDKKALALIKDILLKRLKSNPGVYSEHLKDILFVCFPYMPKEEMAKLQRGYKKAIDCLLSDHPLIPYEVSVDDRLGNIKGVLFSPFKLHTDNWSPLALQLALKGFGGPVNFYEMNSTGNSLIEMSRQDWMVMHDWTPIGYGAVLDFLLKCCAQYKNRSVSGKAPKLLSRVVVKPTRRIRTEKEFFIKLYFSDGDFYDQGLDQGKLNRLLNDHVLQVPRDWRVEQVSLGNFQKPFVDFCNKLLGLIQLEEAATGLSGWVKRPARSRFEDDERVLMVLERPKKDSRTSKSGEEQMSRFFEVSVGAEPHCYGIMLWWYERATSEDLKDNG